MSSEPRRAPIPPKLIIFIGIMAVSTASIFIRFAQKDVASLVIAAYRLCLASLVLGPVAWKQQRGEIRRLDTRVGALLFLSGFLLAIHFASWITSLEYTTVISSVVLVSTTPLWVAILSSFVLKERVGLLLRIGLIIALGGGIVVSAGQSCQLSGGILNCPKLLDFGGVRYWGNLLALIGAWSGAGYLVIGKKLRPSISIVSYTFLVYGSAAIVLLATAILTQQRLYGYPFMDYVYFLGLALIPQLIGHSSFNWSLRYLSATYVSVSLLGEPIGSTILAYFILGEIPTFLEISGAVMILLGIYLASRSEKN